MAKKLKVKLPKRIAGVKIPKSVRKGPVADFLNSTAGQVVLAQTLVATAGALAVKGADADSPTGDALRHPIDTVKRAGRSMAHVASEATDRTAAESGHLAFALGEAVRAFRAAMERDDWEVARDAQEPSKRFDLEAEPVAKKKPSGTAPH